MAGVARCDGGHVQHHRRRISRDACTVCDLHDHRRVGGPQPGPGVSPIERGATWTGVHQTRRRAQHGIGTRREVAGDVDDEVGRSVGVDRHRAVGADPSDDGVGDGLPRGMVDVGGVRARCAGRIDRHMARAERLDRGHVQHHRRRISRHTGTVCDLHDHRRVGGPQPRPGISTIERGRTGTGVHQTCRRTQRHVLRRLSRSSHVSPDRHRRRSDHTNEHGQRPHSARNPNPTRRTHPDHLRDDLRIPIIHPHRVTTRAHRHQLTVPDDPTRSRNRPR